MATIRIQNFGPIKDSGIVELTTILLIIGRQSAGKSTFMKVLSYCRWLEKKVMTSFEQVVSVYTHNERFKRDLMLFHRINDIYFHDDTKIEYDGDVLSIVFPGDGQNAKIIRKEGKWENRYNSKITYIPAERNLVSAVKNIDVDYKAKERDVLFNFILEWAEAKEKFTHQRSMRLSVTDDFRYYSEDGKDYIQLPDGRSMTAFFASSGIQSVMPLDVMANYIIDLVGQTVRFSKQDLLNKLMEMLDAEDGSKIDLSAFSEEKVSTMRTRMKYQSAQLFVEEPEQNLYPDAQKQLVLNLVRSIKKAQAKGEQHSSLVMTTHSPYILSVINVLIAEAGAVEKRPDDARIKALVDDDTLLQLSEYSAYHIDKNGVFQNIKEADIPMFSGIELDEVSDWVNEKIDKLNLVLYGDAE